VSRDPSRSAHERLGEELVAAAVRQQEQRTSRSRRHRRGRAVLSIAVAAVLGAGAVAGAARLIATGEPLPDRTAPDVRNRPAAGAPVLVAQVWDQGRGTSWGVGLYTSSSGEDCAIAGAVRGTELGRIEEGRFRGYEDDYTGVCAALNDDLPVSVDLLRAPGSPPRTIVFGRVRPGERFVQVTHAGRTDRVEVVEGAFVALFDGADLTYADVVVKPGAKP
jgi:hypothetical protein